METSDANLDEEILANARPFELAMALINRAERLVPRTMHREERHRIGDLVLLRRGNQPEGSKFQALMWLGPFKVISTYHPRHGLENALGRRSRKPVYFRRLHQYHCRDTEIRNEEVKNC